MGWSWAPSDASSSGSIRVACRTSGPDSPSADGVGWSRSPPTLRRPLASSHTSRRRAWSPWAQARAASS